MGECCSNKRLTLLTNTSSIMLLFVLFSFMSVSSAQETVDFTHCANETEGFTCPPPCKIAFPQQ